MYSITKILVKNDNKHKSLYEYFMEQCHNYKNLKNVAMFHIRQMKFMADGKDDEKIQAVYNKICDAVPELNHRSRNRYDKAVAKIQSDDSLSSADKVKKIHDIKKPVTFKVPDKGNWFLGYNLLEGVLKVSEDVDYTSLPAQVNQNAIKEVCNNWKAYFKAVSEYRKYPSKFHGMPKFPKYIKEDMATATFTNINCKLQETGDGRMRLSFPKSKSGKDRVFLDLGSYFSGKDIKLIEIKVRSAGTDFEVLITTEEVCKCDAAGYEESLQASESKRVMAIDVGKKNLLAITNNVGLKPILIRGSAMIRKSAVWLEAIDSAKAELRKGLNPKDKTKPYTSKKIKRLYAKRERFLSDYFHKICNKVIQICLDNQIDTIVIGRNVNQKQGINLGKQNNKDYTYIPFTKLYNGLTYLCLKNGIKYVETEESYTSKASFFDKDDIPTINTNLYDECQGDSHQDSSRNQKDFACVHGTGANGSNGGKYIFSGSRITRDLYKTGMGYVINADINGSLNIMRKIFPELTYNIKIKDIAKHDILNFSAFFKNFKPANTVYAV